MEATYQKIADRVLDLNIGDWKRIVFYIQYTDDSFEITFYIKNYENKYINYLDLDLDSDELEDAIMDLDDIIVEHRNEMGKQNDKWSLMTFIIEDSGDCKAEYEYDLDLETAMESKMEWKRQYLV